MDPLAHLSDDIMLLTSHELREFAETLLEEFKHEGSRTIDDVAEALMNTARRIA